MEVRLARKKMAGEPPQPSIPEYEAPTLEERWNIRIYTSNKNQHQFYYPTAQACQEEIHRITTEACGDTPLVKIGNTIFIISNIDTISIHRQSRLGPDDYWKTH
jgi:hypothetical protein